MVDLQDLKCAKNLLAFSGGVDSSALFFMLLEQDIAFDLAIVDYQMRAQSKLEVQYAKNLAKQYQKQCFVLQAKLKESDFENHARVVRYGFFEAIIQEHGYQHLLMAHQLNDRLEWFLMQFFKGGGLNSLLGFDRVESRGYYHIVRPLWECSKEEILFYLKGRDFFEDASNQDVKYLRNKIRIQYANQMLCDNKKGILNSFHYLREEKNQLYGLDEIQKIGHIFYFDRKNVLQDLFRIDRILKQLGYVCSYKQREEIKRQDFSLCLKNDFLIDTNRHNLFVAKMRFADLIMSKKFKNLAREINLPKRIRKEFFGLLQMREIDLEMLKNF